MKLLRNFLSLAEFLFVDFFRFMKLSNIMDLSYFGSSTRSKALKKLLSYKMLTCGAFPRWTAMLHNGIWFRRIHSLTNYRFGASALEYPVPCWGMNDYFLWKEWSCEVSFCQKWRHFGLVECWGVSGCCIFWDQFCRAYLGSDWFFFVKAESWGLLCRAASQPSCGNN